MSLLFSLSPGLSGLIRISDAALGEESGFISNRNVPIALQHPQKYPQQHSHQKSNSHQNQLQASTSTHIDLDTEDQSWVNEYVGVQEAQERQIQQQQQQQQNGREQQQQGHLQCDPGQLHSQQQQELQSSTEKSMRQGITGSDVRAMRKRIVENVRAKKDEVEQARLHDELVRDLPSVPTSRPLPRTPR